MDQEIFRFVSVRPVQDLAGPEQPQPLLLRLDRGDSEFIDSLRANASPEGREKLLERVRAFVRSDQFVGSRSQADVRLVDFHAKLGAISDSKFAETANDAFRDTFDAKAETFVRSDDFKSMVRALGDSVVAATIDNSVTPRTRTLLAGIASAAVVIEALAAWEGERGPEFRKSDFLAAVLVLPDQLFPLAQKDSDLRAKRASQRDAQERSRAARLATMKRHAGEINSGRKAIDELLETVSRRLPELDAPPRPRQSKKPSERAQGGKARVAGFELTPVERDALSKGTVDVLRSVGVTDRVDPSRAVKLIEDRLAAASVAMLAAGPSARMVKIGNHVIPSDLFEDLVLAPDQGNALRLPGPCLPGPVNGSAGESDPVTVPTGHGNARILGIADLMIVEQTLARYEMSEIAHIENVLRTEKRERRFRTAITTEESTTIETETIEENEKDLASTERFELQTESQRVINENATKEAGLTIHASYGPTVDATAKLGYTSSTATQRSDRASTSYARETTSRAVNRLHTRAMERRSTKTVREIEEKNLHGFDNSAGATDISGIYRFVDKIYTAQIVNYGKRLMLEFVVPEPAAFWRHALTRQPLDPISYVKPDPLGFCLLDGKTFVPLQALDITPENYVIWAGKYGAEDVQPPPPRARIVSVAKKGPDSFQTTGTASKTAPKINSDAYEIDIPDGYLATSAIVNVYGETQVGMHKVVIQVQEQQFIYVEPVDDGIRLNLNVEPTSKLPVSINSIRFYNYEVLVNVFCVLRREALEQWQLKTFFAIRNAYEAAKARYDNASEAARLQAGFNEVMGRNPAINREIERGELKRACISMATGQRFESFDAMKPNIAPHGYPEIDFADAKAEARWVLLFEQGFEWNNMTYVFYPYFWGRKNDWLSLVQLTDDDPLFGRFLQAGAARVQLPVRPGFESVVMNYLSGIEIWDADGNFVVAESGEESPMFLSIIAELKSQLGNNDAIGEGTLTLTAGSDLVIGSGTAFTREDENRRIGVGTSRYVIKSFEAPDRLRLRTPFSGPTDNAASYSLGPRLVGEPWEVRIPTNLVKIDDYSIS
ncbi:MAG: hypothetical protein LH610_08060 [Sphingomonas bacterium]|nr:hypothetical protein [Sphingomonas bacterium]